MKQLFFLTLLLLATAAQAQHTVTFDYAETDATKRMKHTDTKRTDATTVAESEHCTFVVTNINTFLYEVQINSEVVDLHSDPPAAFQLFFKAENFTGAANALTESASKPMAASTNVPEVRTLYGNSKPKTKAEAKAAEEAKAKAEAEAKAKAEAEAKAKAEAKKASDEYNQKLKDFQNSLQNLENWKRYYNQLLSTVQTDGKTGADIIQDVNELMKIRNIEKPTDILNKGTTAYTETQKALEDLIQAFGQLTEEEREAKKDELKSLLALQTKIEAFDYPAFFIRFSILYKQAINPQTYIVMSPPILAEQDFINFKIEIKPRTGLLYAQPLQSTKFDYLVRVRNGFKIDYSTGVFFAFGEARGRTYRLDPVVGDSTRVSITQNSPTALTLPALGAAIHGSWRFSSRYALGGMLGIGLNSTSLANPNFYLGVSNIFGWRERFIFSMGYAFNSVDYLAKDYRVDQIVLKNSISADKLTEKTFRGGFYFALTFNLSNKKQGQ